MLGLLACALLAGPVEVEWHAPGDCPSGEDFASRVSEHAGDVLPLRVSVEVRAGADGAWQAELTMEREGSPTERRTIEGESCQAVSDAAVLIVDLRKNRADEASSETLLAPPPPLPETTGPTTREPLFDDSPEARPQATEDATSVSPRPRLDDDATRRGSGLGAWLSLSGGVAAGILPGVGGAAALDLGIDGAAWRVGIGGRLLPARTQRSTDVAVEGRFALATGGVLGCYVPRLGAWEFPVCARVDVGGLRGEGQNATQTRVVWPLWAGASASASAHWQVAQRIAPFATVEGTTAILTPSYGVGSVAGAFFQAGRLGGRVWLGLEIRLKNGPQKR